MSELEPVDVRPELLAWFHESEEICEHDGQTDDRDWPCGIMADHLLRAFTVEPRLYEVAPGHWGYEERHFRRLELAASLATPDRDDLARATWRLSNAADSLARHAKSADNPAHRSWFPSAIADVQREVRLARAAAGPEPDWSAVLATPDRDDPSSDLQADGLWVAAKLAVGRGETVGKYHHRAVLDALVKAEMRGRLAPPDRAEVITGQSNVDALHAPSEAELARHRATPNRADRE